VALQQLATDQYRQQQQQLSSTAATAAVVAGTGTASTFAAGTSSAAGTANSMSNCAVGHPAVAAAFLQELAAFSRRAAAGEATVVRVHC
jgi:hypothetical protein